MTRSFRRTALPLAVLAALVIGIGQVPSLALAASQAPAPGRGAVPPRPSPPPDPTKPVKLEITQGTTARYKVREQLAGISFPSDAVGTTQAVTGIIVINPDGSLDAKQSKITVDLRLLKSDQEMRDGYVQQQTLETAKFPLLEFVPTRAEGLPKPLPAAMQAQAGFKLTGDMTLHGVKKEVTWTVIATFGVDQVGDVRRRRCRLPISRSPSLLSRACSVSTTRSNSRSSFAPSEARPSRALARGPS